MKDHSRMFRGFFRRVTMIIGVALLVTGVTYSVAPALAATAANAVAPDSPRMPDRVVRLIFIHHSTGEYWLADDHGELGLALQANRYFVSDTNYGWGPATPGGSVIGDLTDIGQWWTWFSSPERDTYLRALYAESEQHCGYSRLETNPGGQNEIVMFKSCFPNSALQGNPDDPVPAIDSNPLRGEGSGSDAHTVANAKGIYIELLNYFKTRRDRLFIVVTAPPLVDPTYAANARAFNQWLVNDWLTDYPYPNVFVFDFYNVLTTNGGSPTKNDLGQETGNHHRWWNGAIQHKTDGDNDGDPNVLEYPTGDDHPSRAGDLKAKAEFVRLLNVAYNRWRPPVGASVDAAGLTWKSGGAAKWFGETAVCLSGGAAAQSGRIGNGQVSWLETTVTGPGTFSFRWRVSSQENADTLRLTLDGAPKGRISGTTGWVRKAVVLEAGTHTLRWTYRKDASDRAGRDAAWLDKVQWVPGS